MNFPPQPRMYVSQLEYIGTYSVCKATWLSDLLHKCGAVHFEKKDHKTKAPTTP